MPSVPAGPRGQHDQLRPYVLSPSSCVEEAERLAAELARQTGETKIEAVTKALRDRLERVRRKRSGRRLADELEAIAEHCSGLPVLDARTPEEILGYDKQGLPR